MRWAPFLSNIQLLFEIQGEIVLSPFFIGRSRGSKGACASHTVFDSVVPFPHPGSIGGARGRWVCVVFFRRACKFTTRLFIYCLEPLFSRALIRHCLDPPMPFSPRFYCCFILDYMQRLWSFRVLIKLLKKETSFCHVLLYN